MNNDASNSYRTNDSSPPRQRVRAESQSDPAVERAFDYLLNTLFGHPEPDPVAPSEHDIEDVDVSDMPSLVSSTSRITGLPASVASDNSSSTTMDIDDSSHRHSQEMPPMRIDQRSSATDSQTVDIHLGQATVNSTERRTVQMDPGNDSDNDMPALLDLSDSDNDVDDVEMLIGDVDGLGSGNVGGSSSAEDQIVHDFADMPALEPVNQHRRTTVEDDPEETTFPTSWSEAIRTGSRRTFDEVDDRDDVQRGPGDTPSMSSTYVTPTDTPTQTLSRSETPAGASETGNRPDRPLRPLPRNRPPPLRATPILVNTNPLFGAPGLATAGLGGQAFDANALLRQLFNGLAGIDGALPTQAPANGNVDVNAATHANVDQRPAPPPPARQSAAGTETPNANGPDNANPTFGETMEMAVHFFDEAADQPMAGGVAGSDFINFVPFPQHQQQNNDTAAQETASRSDGNPSGTETPGASTGAGTDAGRTEMDMFIEMMRAILGGEAGGNFVNLGSLFGETNQEDPERARRLVAGMDHVSESLIKRMVRVGGAPGMHDDTSGDEGGEVQCAVCWDSLLNAEGASFEASSQPASDQRIPEIGRNPSEALPAAVPDHATDTAPASQTSVPTAETNSTLLEGGYFSSFTAFTIANSLPGASPEHVGSVAMDPPELPLPIDERASAVANSDARETKKQAEANDDKEKETNLRPLPKVVALPCAHVFHSSCLLPWFSRPGQTTCPVCRFNIDPENLTYRPPRRAQVPPRPQQQQNGQRTPGVVPPMNTAPGTQWTIHTGTGIGPQWAMRGIRRPTASAGLTVATPPPVTENINVRPESVQDTQSTTGTATPSQGQSVETQSNNSGGSRSQFYVPPIPPFIGRPQHGPHVHPNINPQRLQADWRHHAARTQAQVPTQRRNHFFPNIHPLFFHQRGQENRGPQSQPQPQPQTQLPQREPGPHSDIGANAFRVFLDQQRQAGGQEQGRPQQGQQQEIPQPRQQTTLQFGMARGTFDHNGGETVTMNLDFIFTPSFPQTENQGAPTSTPAETGTSSGSSGNGSDTAQNAPGGDVPPPLQAQAGRQGADDGFPLFEMFTRAIPDPVPFGGMRTTPGNASRSRSVPAQRRQRKEWTPPSPPGLTFRQRIEKREREAGLRCDDVNCGLAPTEEDPLPQRSEHMLKTIAIRRDGTVDDRADPVCAHRFHAACLVDAGRVAGWGAHAEEEGVEVSCPVCRTIGHVEREEWEAGVKASESLLV